MRYLGQYCPQFWLSLILAPKLNPSGRLGNSARPGGRQQGWLGCGMLGFLSTHKGLAPVPPGQAPPSLSHTRPSPTQPLPPPAPPPSLSSPVTAPSTHCQVKPGADDGIPPLRSFPPSLPLWHPLASAGCGGGGCRVSAPGPAPKDAPVLTC